MNPTREQKNFINYFKRWDGFGSLGVILMVIGVFCLMFGHSYLSYFLMVGLTPLGLAFFLYSGIGRAHEGDFAHTVDECMERIAFREVEETPHFRRRYFKEPEVFSFSDFVMREGVMVKRRKSGHLCSSRYLCAKIMLLTDAFYAKVREFSFVSDEKTERIEEILFESLERIEIVRGTCPIDFGKATYLAKTCELVFTYDGGKTLSLPVKDDIYAEEFAEKLLRIAGKEI